MEIHVFGRLGRDSSNMFLVKAESELEAKGRMHDQLSTGISAPYLGTINELFTEHGEENVVNLQNV